MNLKQRRRIFFGLILLSLFIIRYHFALPLSQIESDKYVGQEVEFVGKVVAEPDERDDYVRYIVKVEEFGSKILITANRFPRFNYGDVVVIGGRIDFPKNFETDLGPTSQGSDGASKVFDYKNYLAKDGIRYIAFRPQMQLVETGRGSRILTTLFHLKSWFVGNVSSALPEPHASLANGITLGLKRSLGQELLDIFRTAGIVHIVVLSGYNMTIILAGVIFTLGRFPRISRNISLILAAILTIGFAALVGFTATVLRASIMALLAILARYLGRPVLAMRTLLIAGASMLFWNPLILFYDPSFQLSFLATFGLIAVSPLVERKVAFLQAINQSSQKWKQVLQEIFTATVSTQIFVLPALIYMTGQFSLVSLPVNLLVLPAVPFAMFFTGIVGVLGFVPVISKILALPAYLILEYIIKVSEISAKIPFSSIAIPSIPLGAVFICYAIYLLLLRNSFRQTPNSN